MYIAKANSELFGACDSAFERLMIEFEDISYNEEILFTKESYTEILGKADKILNEIKNIILCDDVDNVVLTDDDFEIIADFIDKSLFTHIKAKMVNKNVYGR